MFDYSKLRGRIVEIYGSMHAFAEAMGFTRVTLSNKLNNRSMFTQLEIVKAMDLLGIDDARPYFFKEKALQNNVIN